MSDSRTRYEFFKRDQEIESLTTKIARMKKEMDEQGETDIGGLWDALSELERRVTALENKGKQ